MKFKKHPPNGPSVMVWAILFITLSCVAEPDYLIVVWVVIPALYFISRSHRGS